MAVVALALNCGEQFFAIFKFRKGGTTLDPFLEELEKKRAFLTKQINEITAFLSCAPDGKLRCMKKGADYQFYWITEKGNTNGKYIPKKDHRLASLLAQKTYDQTILKFARAELAKIESLIRFLQAHDYKGVYERASEARKKLISPFYVPDKEYVEWWKSRDYEKMGFGENDPGFYTINNERVRSKTEILIANLMHQKNIPYLYEVPLNLLKFGTVHCDFCGLNVRKRKTLYHEHFGMMDDPEYCEKALRKINAYQKNGYILGDNFIATFESKNQPLDMQALEKILDYYYL